MDFTEDEGLPENKPLDITVLRPDNLEETAARSGYTYEHLLRLYTNAYNQGRQALVYIADPTFVKGE